MRNTGFFNDIVDEKLLDLNTAYVAKVISVIGNEAKVQPLNMIKQYGKSAQKPSPITIPILKNARYKLTKKTIRYVSKVSNHSPEYNEIDVAVPTEIAAGDVVFCVCADRNITEAKKGVLSTPQIGHHSMSDSVIVGIL